MQEKVKKIARKKIGSYLKSIREEKKISTYKMVQNGVRMEVQKAIENGTSNYTIDNFLKYIQVLDCYFYLAPKDGKHLDLEDMISKM